MADNKKPGLEFPSKLLARRAEAETRVVNAARAVARQTKIAATFRRRGLNANDAEVRLTQLEQKLSDFKKQLATLTARGDENN